jgi:non-specific serine/threonine protein kinase
LAGRKAFAGNSVPEILSAILRDEPDWKSLPSEIPASIRELLAHCLKKETSERLSDVSEARIEIEGLLAQLQQPSGRSSRSYAGIRGSRRPRLRAAALGGVALVGLFVALFALGVFNAGKTPIAKPTEPITLVVLPLQVLTGKEQIGYLGVGISDAIITRLANISQLRVRPTSSILRYRDQPPEVQEVGKALNAENVLSGTLQQVGSRLRVSVQLVRVSDSAPLWGQHYDLTQQDLLSLQDQVAERVTTALKIRATAAERERVYRRYTQNVEAYNHYLRGQAQLSYGEGARAAVEEFERALEIDPNYALAHAGLAHASGLMYNTVAADAERKQWGERAEREASAALAIDPNLAEAHVALASYYQLTEFKWDRTIEECRRALELNPALDRPHVILAGTYLHVGMLDLVEGEIRASAELNPVGGIANVATMTGVAALWGGRFADAVPLLEQALHEVGSSRERPLPQPLVQWNLGNAYYYVGKWPQAQELLARTQRGNEPDVRAQAALASFLAARGERTRAEELLKQVIARPSFEHHAMYSAGAAYAQLGRPEEALSMLRQSRDTGFFCYPFFQHDPLLRPLAHDPEFQKFMEEFRQSWEAFRVRYGVGSQ